MRTLLISLILAATLFAQERVLLRIGPDGQQEAIPLKKGESARAVIEQRERSRAVGYTPLTVAGLIDTLKHFNTTADLTTNFGWNHQDVAMQWYQAGTKGTVKEFWWRNYLSRGTINKGTIRAWHVNSRFANFPSSPNTKFIGTYKDPADGDGGVTPFKPVSGNQWFYGNGAGDSMIYSYEPFTKEANWLAGGVQVTLDSNAWQGVKLQEWGDSMNVQLGELFGFTLSNDTKKSDFGAGTDARMELLSWASGSAPYHSYKYYETGRTAPSNAGWHMRGDYEWGMYTVIEYTGDRAPRISIQHNYNTTYSADPRAISAVVTDDNPGGGAAGVETVRLFNKRGSIAPYDSVVMTGAGSNYSGLTLKSIPGDTIFWCIVATDVNGNRSISPVRSYGIFKRTKNRLFIYNNVALSRFNALRTYTGSGSQSPYDFWSAPMDGTEELLPVMELYQQIVLIDGSFPSRNVYPSLKARFAKATSSTPVWVFFSSQDYGCYIQPACADTTFSAGAMEYDYLGLSQIGTQDIAPTDREFRVVPQPDSVTNYLIRYGQQSGSTLWCDPTSQFGVAGFQDNIVPGPRRRRS